MPSGPLLSVHLLGIGPKGVGGRASVALLVSEVRLQRRVPYTTALASNGLDVGHVG